MQFQLGRTPVVRVCRQDQCNESTETNAECVHVQQNGVQVKLRACPFDDAVSLARSADAIGTNHETHDLKLVGDISAED